MVLHGTPVESLTRRFWKLSLLWYPDQGGLSGNVCYAAAGRPTFYPHRCPRCTWTQGMRSRRWRSQLQKLTGLMNFVLEWALAEASFPCWPKLSSWFLDLLLVLFWCDETDFNFRKEHFRTPRKGTSEKWKNDKKTINLQAAIKF